MYFSCSNPVSLVPEFSQLPWVISTSFCCGSLWNRISLLSEPTVTQSREFPFYLLFITKRKYLDLLKFALQKRLADLATEFPLLSEWQMKARWCGWMNKLKSAPTERESSACREAAVTPGWQPACLSSAVQARKSFKGEFLPQTVAAKAVPEAPCEQL